MFRPPALSTFDIYISPVIPCFAFIASLHIVTNDSYFLLFIDGFLEL
jgi:hypothetical protein